MASPSGLAPHGAGSATLCETFGFTQLRSAKDKSIAHYVRSHKSVCNECVLACARTKDKKPCTKACFMWLAPYVLPPPGPVPLGLTLHRALKKRVPCTKACFMIEHAHCVRTKAFMVMLARWRLHKGVFYENTSWLYCQCACN